MAHPLVLTNMAGEILHDFLKPVSYQYFTLSRQWKILLSTRKRV